MSKDESGKAGSLFQYNKTQDDQWRGKNGILSTTGVSVFIARKE